jgi:hypothetical protein
MMSEIGVKPLPLDSGLVEATAEEVAAHMMAVGTVMTTMRDGKLYRVLDPWETGEATTAATS